MPRPMMEVSPLCQKRDTDELASVVDALDLSTKISKPLMVPELFYNLLEWIDPTIDNVESQKLVSLALSCRAFSEPSLDRLWRRLHSLVPLIKCYTSIDDFQNQGPPNHSQFAIINKYSHRIRELTISDESSVRFLQCTSMRSSVLLPNLTVLGWSHYIAAPHIPIILIQQLLSPTLVSLKATLSERDEAILLSFFDIYPLLCPNLKSIEFRFDISVSPLSPATIQALSRAICSQNALENVLVHGPVHRLALEHLCKLPALKQLTVDLSPSSIPPKDAFQQTDPILCNVVDLGFAAWNLDHVTRFLRPQYQKFHTFCLYHHGRRTSEAVFQFLKVLASRPPTAPLHQLTLSIGDFSRPIPEDRMPDEAPLHRLSYETLQPLQSLSCLRYLMIEWSEQICLDDEKLIHLARSWPYLQVFHLTCGRGGYSSFPTKYPTLAGLLSLVDACPDLCIVSLPLDARQVPVFSESDAKQARKSKLVSLIVPESPIDAPGPVANFLITYLPSVTMVDYKFFKWSGPNVAQIMAYERAWMQVDECLDLYSSRDAGLDAMLEFQLEAESDVESSPDPGGN